MESGTTLRAIALGTLALAVTTASAGADPRPFGVLAEGVLEITAYASFDAGIELAGGRVVASGVFNRVARVPQADLVLLEADGSPVAGFAPHCAAGPGATAASRPCRGGLLALPDGGFLLAGDFGAVDGVAAGGLARFDADGVRVAGYDPLAEVPGRVVAMVLAGDQVLVAFSEDTGGTVRRFGLESAAVPDPGFLHSARVSALVADQQGRPFALLEQGIVRRLLPHSGATDPGWTSGVTGIVRALARDPVTDRLFVLVWNDQGQHGTVRRLDPDAPVGLDELWSAGADPAQPGVAFQTVALEAAGNGQVLIGDRLILPGGEQAQGQRVVSAVDGQFQTFVPGAQAVEPLAPRTPTGWLVADTELRQVDAGLAPVAGFAPRVRRAAGVNDVARAPDGRAAIVGTMTEVDGLPRAGVARLAADFSLDVAWPNVAIEPASPCGRHRCTRARVSLHGSGAVVAMDHVEGAPLVFLIGPTPRTVAIDATGSQVRYRWSNRGEVLAGPGDLLYLSPVGQVCPAHQPNLLIGRITIAMLLSDACQTDATWAVTSTSSSTVPVLSPDGAYLYFATLEQASLDGIDWRVRRVATTPGAVPDPGFAIDLRSTAESRFHLALAIDGDHLYLADRIVAIGAMPWTGPARVDRHHGELDLTWQPGVDRRVLRIDAAGGWVFLLRSAADSSTATITYPLEVVRIPAAAASPGAAQVLATDGRFGDRIGGDTRVARILALGDHRAIVAGHFSDIDGVARDGFAVVGSVEGIFADGFEAP
ncbi:MAG: delta-60 repeat domain-containing protein [Xanthomonadales bacterium]|nr:delta-60 repeat domain-containing protein [Xanthomonadales bacterium]